MNKIYLALYLIIFLLISSVSLFSGGEPLAFKEDRVSIDILSKHVKVMKEAREGSLVFSFPLNAEIVFPYRESLKNLKIVFADSVKVLADGRLLDYGVYNISAGDASEFSLKLSDVNDIRIYPLPLKIIYSPENLKFIIEEKKIRYAIDSSFAEMGGVRDESFEAFKALAILIYGRCSQTLYSGKHSDADFCDLSCCQVYRGRQSITLPEFLAIDVSALRKGLYFCASGGGRLFSDGIFSNTGRRYNPPADVLLAESLPLSKSNNSQWSCEIMAGELSKIFFTKSGEFIEDIIFSLDKEIVSVKSNLAVYTFAPEDFRLRINRLKGWNFLRSNNYTVKKVGDKFIFNGSGLGHGVGLSMDGAIELSHRGFSAYEILEHYYPDIKYISFNRRIYSQYILFDTENGKILKSSGKNFYERRIPFGSIFKILVTLYLWDERRDLLNYRYTCLSENQEPLPLKCWDKNGHGSLDLKDALSLSCNIYFASLYNKINRDSFYQWIRRFKTYHGLKLEVPYISDDKKWPQFLAGLDFRCTMTVSDFVKLVLILNKKMKEKDSCAIFFSDSLKNTFIIGTARPDKGNFISQEVIRAGIWGKTSTIIYGSNFTTSYGLFVGAIGEKGIVTLLRKSVGRDAANLSAEILYENCK